MGHVQRALDDLEQSVRPRSVERFELLAEAYRDQIAELAEQIAAYESRGQWRWSASVDSAA